MTSRRIVTYMEALGAIHERAGYDRGFISNPFAGDDAARRGLRRTRAMLDLLGNPDRAYPIVHVAGSKGKGSTCMLIDGMLRAAALRCGRYLSPHLHSWRERFVVNDTRITEAEFAGLTGHLIAAAERVEETSPELGQVTAFELSTAMALRWFQQAGCDVAVIEVGLGGTLDATNVVDPAVSVITQLDYEHTAILGTSMAEIAGNKAGIIKPGCPVVSAAQPDEGMRVIVERAAACDVPLLVAGRDWTVDGTDRSFTATGPWGKIEQVRTAMAGRHQVENAALAFAAVHTVHGEHPTMTGIDAASMRAGIETIRHPGRFEEVNLASGQVVVIDGAHSPASTAALSATIRDHYPGAELALVVGMLNDKDPLQVLPPLLEIADRCIAVTPENPRAIAARELEAAIVSLGGACLAGGSVTEGMQIARESGLSTILVTGSLITAAEARVALGLA